MVRSRTCGSAAQPELCSLFWRAGLRFQGSGDVSRTVLGRLHDVQLKMQRHFLDNPAQAWPETMSHTLVGETSTQIDAVAVLPASAASASAKIAVAVSSLEGNTWDGGFVVFDGAAAAGAGASADSSAAAKPAARRHTLFSVDSGVTSIKWLKDGSRVVIGCDNGEVQVRDGSLRRRVATTCCVCTVVLPAVSAGCRAVRSCACAADIVIFI